MRQPLKELRRRYVTDGDVPSPRLLNELSLDPRAGAQALYRTLKKRREAKRAEEVRIGNMLNFERLLWQRDVDLIAGVDEAGLGPIAGPAVAAAVVLPRSISILLVDDSKKLDAATRERLEVEIRARAVAVSVAEISVEDLDRLNVYRAGLEAMRRAVVGLEVSPQHVLTDARTIPGLGDTPQNAFQKGDGLNYSIACASIIAKVFRDRRMAELDEQYPGYGFAEHKGYGTAKHLEAVRRLGASPIHRRSFPVIEQILGNAGKRFYELKDGLDAATSLQDLAQVAHQIRTAGSDLDPAEARKLSALLTRRRRKLTPN